MIVDITKATLTSADEIPQKVIDKVVKYREVIDYVDDLKTVSKNVKPLTSKQLIKHMHLAANNISRLLLKKGFTEFCSDSRPTVFTAILERNFNELKAEL